MASKKDDFEKILSDNVDFKKRRIYFGNLQDKEDGSEFNWGTIESVVRALHLLSENSQKPIELHMSSGGGDFVEMLRLHDAIQKSPCQIKFFGSGYICSSAAIIMVSCDERYLDKHTEVMVHKGEGGITHENEADMQIEAEHNRKRASVMTQILADNTRMPKEYWDKVTNRDLYLSAEEAIALGMADRIVEFKKRGNLRRIRIAHLNKKVDDKNFTKLLEDLNSRIHLGGVMRVELHVPKERFDKDVYVDDSVDEPSDNKKGLDKVETQEVQSK